MAGVAKLAEKIGYIVTGCDLEENTAYAKNVFKGHSPEHLKGIDLLVVSPAVYFQNNKSHELLAGEKKGIVVTWQEFLGKVLLKDKKVIAIAGTHGKSTTTAMAGKLLIDAGLDPIVVVGAFVPEWEENFRFGKGEWAIVEADEFNNNFLNYNPYIEVINNIEFDHPDYFKSEEDVKKSFIKFLDRMKADGTLIINWNDGGIQRLLLDKMDPQKVESFKESRKFKLKVFGLHNQANAMMVFKLGRHLGIPEETIIKSLESFKGIGRRMELITDKNGTKVYDDYAHHPTAIKTTLAGLREKYPKAKILAIVEPHGYKRTKALMPRYKGVFDSIDKVIVGPIFPARDKVDELITPQKVAEISGHKNAAGLDGFLQIIKNTKPEIKNYNVIVVMGAGKSYLWAEEIAKMVSKPEEMKIKKDKQFKDLTKFRIGGKIKAYAEAKTKEEVAKAVSFAKSHSLPVFILGGGSDILAGDGNFDGLVIKFIGKGYRIKGDIITAEGGMKWDELVHISVKNNLQGIECLSGIPGKVGAAPIQNIGAYGQELKDTFVSLEAFDIKNERFVTFNNKDCKFAYRESVFKNKNNWQKFIIVEITLRLRKNIKPEVNYESLKKYVGKNPSLQNVRDAVLKVRSEKLEDTKKVGNAGSFFKNPIVSLSKKEELEKIYPDIKFFPSGKNIKIPAAWLIEKAGWKGKTYKNAAVSEKHALCLINKTGKAKASEIFKLAEMIEKDIQKKFGITLTKEVQLINFKNG